VKIEIKFYLIKLPEKTIESHINPILNGNIRFEKGGNEVRNRKNV